MSLAFLEDDATAIGQPSDSTAWTKRSVREGLHAPGLDQIFKPLLLALCIADCQPRGIGHAKRLKGGTGANHTRLAGDIGLVHLGGEQVRIGYSAQRFAPGVFMRRREQDAIDIENGCFQCSELNGWRCR